MHNSDSIVGNITISRSVKHNGDFIVGART